MGTTLDDKACASQGSDAALSAADMAELALLAEFTAHESVGSLARAIAQRLGEATRDEDLIARANLDVRPVGAGGGHAERDVRAS